MINGLPLHPLVVHFSVVLVPLLGLLTIAIALWPKLFPPLRHYLLALTITAALFTFLAKQTGGELSQMINQKVREHAQLGAGALLDIAPLIIGNLLLWFGFKKIKSKKLSLLFRVFLVIAALFATVQIFRVGHSGSAAVWGWVANI